MRRVLIAGLLLAMALAMGAGSSRAVAPVGVRFVPQGPEAAIEVLNAEGHFLFALDSLGNPILEGRVDEQFFSRLVPMHPNSDGPAFRVVLDGEVYLLIKPEDWTWEHM